VGDYLLLLNTAFANPAIEGRAPQAILAHGLPKGMHRTMIINPFMQEFTGFTKRRSHQ
jgi:hypothetical protein